MPEMCLRQTKRPLMKIETKGWGNCLTCEPDENNKYCEGYWPIEVKENTENDNFLKSTA